MSGAIDFGDWEGKLKEFNVANGSLLGFVLRDADMELTTDQEFERVVDFTKYRVDQVIAVRKTGAFSGACAGGIYSAAAKGGNAWVAAGQSYAGLTGANKMVTCTNAAVVGTDVASTVPVLSLTTGNGAALTADFFMFVQVLD